MNQKNQKKMDTKKTKRRKSSAGKRHGRAESEEKPKTAEVMNEKEKQDRLEAASVLSSLMFSVPKTPGENENTESGRKSDLVTPSTSVTQFSMQPSTSGIPTTSQPTSLVQRGGHGSAGPATLSENATNLKNSMILAQLQSQLNIALKNRNVQPVFSPQTVFAQNKNSTAARPTLTVKYVTNDRSESPNVPLTVLKQNLTVNKNVAKALRQVVSNNKLKAENPKTENAQKNLTANSETTIPTVSAPEDEHEKMDCDSLPSSRKIGSSDTNLPLKKRRLIGMNDDSLTTSDLNLGSALSANLDTLASARQIENILQMAKDYPASTTDSAVSLVSSFSQPKLQSGEGYRPVQFDPRTSLMVLSDLKFALTPDEDGDLPIHIAVVHENTELVRKFIDIMAISGKTVDRFNKLQQTPLHLAVLVDKPEIISVLLAAGANPNLLDRNGYTCVHIAVNKEQPSCMETLFKESKYPISLNIRDYEGYYPLHTCVELDSLEMMMTLVECGADKDCQDGKAGRSVLLYAVEYNRGHMVQYLLEQGATPDLQNYASVTPMMTAQAANYDDIVACLNKALEIGNKYEDSYIPSKKVPMSKIPSKSAQIVNRDVKYGRYSVSGDMPLIYEEYEAVSRSQSVSDDLKREPLSRQSSASSPIDLSMRHNTESPQPPVEMSIRGKPGRRKTKKEIKNHKEKQPEKSMVKEKHASVVAALERSMFAEKTFPVKGNIQVEPYIKVEVTDSEDVEMRNQDEREESVDVETVRAKSSSEALNNFILNLKPDQTKYLVEKVKQQLSVQKSDDTSLASNAHQRYATKSPTGNETDHRENSAESDSEIMHQSLEKDGVKGKKDGTEKDLQNETQVLISDNEYSEMVVSENESGFTQTEEIKMIDDFENITENIAKKTIESPVTVIQSQSSSHSPEADDSKESDLEEIDMDHNSEESDKHNTEHTVESPETDSENISDDDPKSASLNEACETDTSLKLAHEETMSEDTKESGEEYIDNSSEQGNAEEISGSIIESEQSSNSKDFVSQVSQESASSSSLHGSQGFEVISPPVLNVNPLRETGGRELEHSEDSMEVEFSGNTSNNKTVDHINVDVSDADNTTPVDDGDNNENAVDKTLEFNVIEKKSKASMDSDEDDEESGLVIDEHVSEDENLNNVHKYEIHDKTKSKGVGRQTDSENSFNSHADVGNSVEDKNTREKMEDNEINKVGQKDNEVENGKSGKEDEFDDLKSNCRDKSHMNSGKTVETKKQGFSDGKTIGNSGKSSVVSDVKSSVVETVPQGIKDKEMSMKSVSTDGLSQSAAPDEMLKKGQSHTLYYHDGDGYKPVKIFIDNSEQSSLVLQRMFQSAQLSNVNRQAGLVPPGDIKTETQSGFSETRTSVEAHSSYSNVTLSQLAPARSAVQNVLTAKDGDKPVNNALMSSSSNLNIKTVSVTNVRPSVVAPGTLPTEQSFQQAYIESLKQASNDTEGMRDFTKQIKKRTIPTSNKVDFRGQTKTASQSTKQKVQKISKSFDSQTSAISVNERNQSTKQKVHNASKSFDSLTSAVGMNERNQKFGPYITTLPTGRKVPAAINKPVNFLMGKYSSEGTLTRVNPDVRSKLSKALQSPQRKVGLVRSDSDTYILNNRGVMGNVVTSVPGTVSTSVTVTDSRQQL